MATEYLQMLLLLLYGACLLFIFSYSLMQLNLTLLFLRSKKAIQADFPILQEWPAVTVQLPVYNEQYVVERLLQAATSLDYPKDKLQIQVLDDSTDETVAIIAEKVKMYRSQGNNIVHVRRRDRSGFKAGALQYGLYQASGEFIAIFDADFVPAPDFLRKVLPAFDDPQIGVVQTRWGHLNAQNSLLTRLQAFGLNAHFTIEQGGRNFGNHFINFNGTAGIWRRGCITDAGGWQADTLTEDLDLSYRAQLRGWKFRYLQNEVVPAELPVDLPALKSQQYRWTKGAAETARKHAGKLWDAPLPLKTKTHAWFHLLNSGVFLSVFLASLLSLPLLFLNQHSSMNVLFFRLTTFFLTGFGVLAGFYWVTYRQTEPEGNWRRFIPKFLLFLSFSLGLSLHNAVAVAEGYLGRKTPFIRTPKYNLTDVSGTWKTNSYRISALSKITLLEGLLALIFWAALVVAFQQQNFKLLFFHLMLAVGYSLVFYFSIRHSFTR